MSTPEPIADLAPKALGSNERAQLRARFLDSCDPATTQYFHRPILFTNVCGGRLNPAGRGNAEFYSISGGPQSTVAFDTVAEYEEADRAGRSKYGGAEYGVVQTPESARVCETFSNIHGGRGAVILPSGLSAIKTVLETFLETRDGKPTILIPDNRYGPTERALKKMVKGNPHLEVHHYKGNASGPEVETLIRKVEMSGRRVDLLYLEAPGSDTFEIPELHQLIAIAQERGIKTAMDNSWASHTRFLPLAHGVDIAIQATTKYEGGYGDTPSGIVIARTQADFKRLSDTVRANGNGAVDPGICNRLFNRVASTEERIDRHFESALQIMQWLKEQNFTGEIFCPALPSSPDHERFNTYFRKGNGLLMFAFKDNIPEEAVDSMLDATHIIRIGESWGSHITLARKLKPERELTELPRGHMVRLSIGLEAPNDIIRDLKQASLHL